MSGSGAEVTDAELARRAAAGDDLAFSLLMRRHRTPLHRFVRRYVGDPDVTLDVLQETFVSAWRALGRYDGRRAFGVWLRAIALNKCRDRGRRAAVRQFLFGDPESAEALRQPDPSPDAERRLVAAERRRALETAIAALPRPLKEALILTYFEEMSHAEAAELLGVTPKAVETRAYRARQQLVRRLGQID